MAAELVSSRIVRSDQSRGGGGTYWELLSVLAFDMAGELLFFFRHDLIAVVLAAPRSAAVLEIEAELIASVTQLVLRAN